MQAGLLTAAERSMIENHKRVNETGQAMNEATARVSLSPFSQSMNCFIMIKDKTGINDTFTFPHQRETWLNLDESSRGSGFHAASSAGGEAVTGWCSGDMQCLFGHIMENIIAGNAHSIESERRRFLSFHNMSISRRLRARHTSQCLSEVGWQGRARENVTFHLLV